MIKGSIRRMACGALALVLLQMSVPVLARNEAAMAAFERGDLDTAKKLFQADASRGDADADAFLAYIQLKQLDAKQHADADGLEHLRQLSQKKLPTAQALLAQVYLTGYTKRHFEDYNSASLLEVPALLRDAAEAGSDVAQTDLGTLLIYPTTIDGKQPIEPKVPEGVEWLKKAAAQGNLTAQFSLGQIYASAMAGEPDFAEAIRYYGMAAGQGDARAEKALAQMHEEGVGVAKDEQKARALYLQSAMHETDKETSAYDVAFQTLRSAHFKEAALQFAEFIRAYPDSKKRPDAEFWLGETYYATGNYEVAGRQFQRVASEYPQSGRAAKALLRLATCFEKTGRASDANAARTNLAVQYPDTQEADEARKLIKPVGYGNR
ncbi:tol-pal system protein YbgF [Dyella sp. LX-66]|uniref:tol-pal system protein YbgF n=1 Tax=unclassified Dyella TaxID=2634549 RepID=UPI001BE002D4|nr:MULTISPECIES: tol-pal system protein YbgF [unclassified Dyella]MBT2115596.1 tol-pal system protein YbgF [Dyella sp. LX-1]MBT2139411.1 tol-pal system protein YbgF [Dyella sp. LX-66]